ncbi:MAG: cyclic nucleotide-binding domain-containing protein [Verrucomicrobia bacterium]|nr:cyclic nucleotide-binding domain-containing protein [Verrucomicrobiota bacterium]
MNDNSPESTYKVWACDNMVYGPIQESVLVQWIGEERILPNTWIHSGADNTWRQASSIDALREHFSALKHEAASLNWKSGSGQAIRPDELRQFEVFSSLSDSDLDQFVRFGELLQIPANELIIKKGDPGDAVYFVLSGEVRVRLLVQYDETKLGVIKSGEFFGEMAMFTQSPRSADILSESDTRLLRLSAEAFLLLIKQVPALAGPVLFAIARVMAGRIAETNSRLKNEVAAEYVWR